MKIIANRFYIICTYLLGIFVAFAAPSPPTPTHRAPPTPPSAPIDENMFYLLIIAVAFGLYIIYKHNLKTKSPV